MKYYKIFSFCGFIFCDLIQNSRIGELIAGMYSILYPIYIYLSYVNVPGEGHFKNVLYMYIYMFIKDVLFLCKYFSHAFVVGYSFTELFYVCY